MSKQTEQFREAVESALHNMYAPEKSFPECEALALASIQASTVKLLLELVGEDEDIQSRPSGVGRFVNESERTLGRNRLRQELRQHIDQLIKDLSNE